MTTAPDPDDKRALFQRIVDDVLRQIEDHELLPNDALPSARKLADTYGVSVMTSQRALRELQYRRITYSVAGRGTFVHPNAIDLLRGDVLREPVDDPELARQSAEYQNEQHRIYARFLGAANNEELNGALADLLAHAQANSDLIDKLIAHQAERGNFAQEPDWLTGGRGRPGGAQPPTRAQRWFADSVRRTAALSLSQPTEPPPPQDSAGEEADAAPSGDPAAESPPSVRRSRRRPTP